MELDDSLDVSANDVVQDSPEASAPPEPQEVDVVQLKAENERLQKQVADNKRKVSQMYEKNLQAQKDKEREILNLRSQLSGEDGDVATIADVATVSKISRIEAEKQLIDAEVSAHRNQQSLLSAVPDYLSRIDEIAEYAKAYRGLTDEQAESFKANPMAEDVSVVSELVRSIDLLKTRQEMNQLKELLQVSDKINSNISASLSSKPLTNSSGNSSQKSKGKVDAYSLTRLSDAELDALS